MRDEETQPIRLLATAMAGLEKVVRRELEDLGYPGRTVWPGRMGFDATLADIARCNIHLRCAERVLIEIGRFPCSDFGQLQQGVENLDWARWIPADGAIYVRSRSFRSKLESTPAIQRAGKRSIVESLLRAHGVTELPETGVQFNVEISIRNNECLVTLDTTGEGLHKRGYRPEVGAAPLRETLAAALVQLSFWRAGRPMIDPFCGSGTIAIEAAMIGRNIAPGLKRPFAAEQWAAIPASTWQEVRDAATAEIRDPLEVRILATDADPQALRIGRTAARAAGVEEDVHFQVSDFETLHSSREYGCVITNPPYGIRLGDVRGLRGLYESIPFVLRKLPSWSSFVLTAYPEFERVVGQTADRRRKLYNGRIECTYYQFHGPRPPKPQGGAVPVAKDAAAEPAPKWVAPQPAFGGISDKTREQVDMFANRLRKSARHLRKWPARGIPCYRLYERDIPEVPLIIDMYDGRLYIAEYDRPHDRTVAEHADWLEVMSAKAAEVLEVPADRVYLKARRRLRGSDQYDRVARELDEFDVTENGLTFRVNLSDYLDTGLFLDHRKAREMVRKEAEGKDFLNLFAYTGSFSVYAAAGGAKSTTTVDFSQKYLDWAQTNFSLNGIEPKPGVHDFIRSDAMGFLEHAPPEGIFDLAVVDPPTFSNSKSLDEDWDLQRDHAALLERLRLWMKPGGVVYFSTNFRKFKPTDASFAGYHGQEITSQTVSEDFSRRRPNRCWRLVAE